MITVEKVQDGRVEILRVNGVFRCGCTYATPWPGGLSHSGIGFEPDCPFNFLSANDAGEEFSYSLIKGEDGELFAEVSLNEGFFDAAFGDSCEITEGRDIW